MQEIWKEIVGYEGYYEVSTLGQIKSLNRIVTEKNGKTKRIKDRIMKQSYNKRTGYLDVLLSKDAAKTRYRVNRLVAIAFIPNPNNKPEVNHKNGVKTDNRASELEWNTSSENKKHANDIGLRKSAKGFKHRLSKPILCLDLYGNKLALFANTREAEKVLNINRANIQSVLKNERKQTFGFGFQYI